MWIWQGNQWQQTKWIKTPIAWHTRCTLWVKFLSFLRHQQRQLTIFVLHTAFIMQKSYTTCMFYYFLWPWLPWVLKTFFKILQHFLCCAQLSCKDVGDLIRWHDWCYRHGISKSHVTIIGNHQYCVRFGLKGSKAMHGIVGYTPLIWPLFNVWPMHLFLLLF